MPQFVPSVEAQQIITNIQRAAQEEIDLIENNAGLIYIDNLLMREPDRADPQVLKSIGLPPAYQPPLTFESKRRPADYILRRINGIVR